MMLILLRFLRLRLSAQISSCFELEMELCIACQLYQLRDLVETSNSLPGWDCTNVISEQHHGEIFSLPMSRPTIEIKEKHFIF